MEEESKDRQENKEKLVTAVTEDQMVYLAWLDQRVLLVFQDLAEAKVNQEKQVYKEQRVREVSLDPKDPQERKVKQEVKERGALLDQQELKV